jgi:hypothetical protein
MIRIVEWLIRCTFICALCSQAVCQISIETIPWEPSLLVKPTDEIPKGSVPKSMVESLRVSGITIVLEETTLIDLQTRLGSMVGHRGDAAGYLEWLCYEIRSDSHRSLLWLMGGETDAGTVGGFQGLQITGSAKVDGRCQPLATEQLNCQMALSLD